MEPNTCQFDNILPQLSTQGVDGIAIEFAPIPPGPVYVPGFWYLYKQGVVGNPGIHDFNNCYCAIKLGMDNSGYIYNNVMTEVNNGILLENCQDRDAIFYHNEITCDYSAQNPYSSSPKGILFNQCDPMNQITITENTIDVVPSGFMSGCLFHSGANLAATAGETIFDNDFNLLSGTNSTFKFGFYGLGCTGTVIGNTNYRNRIHIYDSQMAGFGVYLGNCDQVSVENNLVTGPGFNVGIPGSFVPKGIYAATTTNSVYSCNNLDDLVNGLTFDGVCTGTTDNIKGNTINNYYLGLYYNATSVTGNQNWTGNQWTGTNGYYGAQNDNSPFLNSNYWVLPYAPYLPTLNLGSFGWFGSALHPNFTCPSSGPSPLSGESNNSLISNTTSPFDHTDSIIALSGLSFANYNQELNWAARRNLISKIESNPSALASNSLMSNFYSSNINSSAWKFQSVLNARKQAMQCDPSLSNEISTFRLMTFSLIDSLRIIDSLVKSGVSTTDSIQLLQQELLLISNYNGEGHVLRSSLKLAKSLKKLKVDSVISMNQLLPANQLYEQNEKLVNDIYLKTFAHGNGELTPSEKDILYNIAIQCPYSGGPAVYFARSLYLGYGGVFANDDSLCNLNQSQPQIENALIESMPCTNFKFYPNPARDQITLTWDNDSKGKCIMQFRNSLGVMIGEKEFNLSNGFETIYLSSLLSGVYFISVNYLGNKTNLGKLVVIK